MWNFHLSAARGEKGAILIELAIILPLLLVLALGFAEFGFAFYRLNTLNKLVEDGARYFDDPLIAREGGNPINPIDTSSNNSNVTTAKNIVVYGQTTVGTPIFPPPLTIVSLCATNCTPAVPTDHFRLSATYTHSFMVGAILRNMMRVLTGTPNSLASSITMTASTVMRVE